MYILLVYDVEEKRVAKVHKYLKRHLHWIQNSVFEGELTDSQIETVMRGLQDLIEKQNDSIIIFTAREQRWLSKQILGKEKNPTTNIL
jgi:CRISPR-associated protein Cas2